MIRSFGGASENVDWGFSPFQLKIIRGISLKSGSVFESGVCGQILGRYCILFRGCVCVCVCVCVYALFCLPICLFSISTVISRIFRWQTK